MHGGRRMYKAVILLALLYLIISLLRYYLNRKWLLIYTAFGYENYFKEIAKLQNAGVKYKSKTPYNIRGEAGLKDITQYNIYVKKEDEHLAHQALESK
jgi:hypothetical protein